MAFKISKSERASIGKTESGKKFLKQFDRNVASIKKSEERKKKKSSSSKPKSVSITQEAFGTGAQQVTRETTTDLKTGQRTVKEFKRRGGSSKGRVVSKTIVSQAQLQKEAAEKQRKVFTRQPVEKIRPKQVTLSIKKKVLAQREFERQLKSIREDSSLNILQKEDKLRELFGIQPGLTEKPKEEQKPAGFRPGIQVDTKKEKKTKFKQLEDNLTDYYDRVRNIPVEQRTASQMLGVVGSGTSSAVLKTVRKIPTIVFAGLASLLSPKETARGIGVLVTDATARAALQDSIASLGQRAMSGDVDAFSTFAAEVLTLKSIPGAGKVKKTKFLQKLKQARQISKLPEPTFISKVDLKTGKIRTVGEVSRTISKGKVLKKTIKITTNPKTKKVTGGITIKINKKTIVKKTIDLKDKGAFFFDKATNTKVPKKVFKGEGVVKLKTTKVLSDKPIGKLKFKEGKVFQPRERKIVTESTTFRIINGKKVKVVRPKESTIRFLVEGTKAYTDSIEKVGNQLKKDLLKVETRIDPKTVKTTRTRIRKVQEIPAKKIETFLKSIDYDIEVINGIDRRSRVAKALGLSKNSPIVKDMVVLAEEGFKFRVTQKGVLTLKSLPAIQSKTSKLQKTFDSLLNRLDKLGKPKSFKKIGKKGQLTISKERPSLLKKTEVDGMTSLSKSQLKKVTSLKRDITIPDIKIQIKNINLLKSVGLISSTLATATLLRFNSTLKEMIKENKVSQKKIVGKKIVQKKQIKTKVTDKKAIKQKTPSPRPTPTKTKVATKTKPKPSIKIKDVFVPRLKIKAPKIKLPKPRVPFIFDSKKLDNKVLTFEGVFRERKFRTKPANKKTNPIITKRITIIDTRNRALKIVAQRVDKTLARSLKLEVKGIGKNKKDISEPSELKKFNIKKSKNTPVLTLVENPKSLFDTRGEVREAKKSKPNLTNSKNKKQPKKKTKKPIKKKKKVTKKPLKSKSKTKNKK